MNRLFSSAALRFAFCAWLAIGWLPTAQAQVAEGAFGYYLDALRYSQTSFGGSARYLGIGGAQTALGADVGALAGNPAGLGMYRKSEFTVSPSLLFANTTSRFTADAGLGAEGRQFGFAGSTLDDSRVQFNFHNLGAVFARPKDDITRGSFRGGAFGIALTRANNFHNTFSYEGVNNLESRNPDDPAMFKEYSIADFYANLGNQGVNSSEVNLAFATFLVDTVGGEFVAFPVSFVPNTPFDLSDIRQSGTVEREGAQYQVDFGYGGNFEDKLYFGGALGVVTTSFEELRTYREEAVGTSDFNSLTLTNRYEASGIGINLRGGAIYRPTDALRLGVSVQTPTWLTIDEVFESSLRVRYNNFPYDAALTLTEETATSNIGEYNFSLRTPLRVSGGAAGFIGKNGFISADVEYVDYSAAVLTGEGNELDADNRTVGQLYRPAVNVRLGGELRLNDFRLRAGGALYGDPFEDFDQVDRRTYSLTGGVGYRTSNFFLDFALVHSWRDGVFTPFVLEQGTNPEISVGNRLTNATVTFGSFF